MRWRILPEERTVLYSPAWFLPVDITLAGPPVGSLRLQLERADGGGWTRVDLAPTRTPGGALTFPGLGRDREPLTAAVRRHRAVFSGESYLPLYRALRDGLEFDVHPYDDLHPPAQPARLQRVPLAPAPGYGFPAGTPVLRGQVATTALVPVADVLVRSPYQVGLASRLERTITDRNGRFALPLRWARPGQVTLVSAIDRRSSPVRRGTLKISVPADLGHNHVIQIA